MSLSLDQIRRVAPSVFAERPWHEVSERYTFIPTSRVVEALLDNGFVATSAQQSATRIEGKDGFVRHQLRFRQIEGRKFDDSYPEVLLTNDHAGSGAFRLLAGVFRLVCSNGLIVGTSFGEVRVRHTGKIGDVVDGAFRVAAEFPRVIDQAREWQGLQLSRPEQLLLASAALDVRYPVAGRTNEDGAVAEPPVDADQIIRPVRYQDAGNDLWTTFNRVQEHLTQGGIRSWSNSGRRTRTRAVTGIAENTALNRALWSLAEGFAKLKDGATFEEVAA